MRPSHIHMELLRCFASICTSPHGSHLRQTNRAKFHPNLSMSRDFERPGWQQCVVASGQQSITLRSHPAYPRSEPTSDLTSSWVKQQMICSHGLRRRACSGIAFPRLSSWAWIVACLGRLQSATTQQTCTRTYKTDSLRVRRPHSTDSRGPLSPLFLSTPLGHEISAASANHHHLQFGVLVL